MKSSSFSRALGLSLALFFPPSYSLGQSVVQEKEEPLVRRAFIPSDKTGKSTNSYPTRLVEPNSLIKDNPFTSNPDLRPTEPMKVFQNRLGESLRLTYPFYTRLSPIIDSNFLTKDFYENTFNRDMQRATERGLERTARVLFADPFERAIIGSSFIQDIERKFFQGISGWENDTLPDPSNLTSEGLQGQRERYLNKGFDVGARLVRRNPFLFANYQGEGFATSLRLSGGSIVDSDTFTSPSPRLTWIGELPLTRTISLQSSVTTQYDSKNIDKFPISSYIGTRIQTSKDGDLLIGTNPQSGYGFISYNLRF